MLKYRRPPSVTPAANSAAMVGLGLGQARCPSGLLPTQGGTVTLDGKDLGHLTRSDVARIAGYVPQGYPAYFAYSVREFVLMGRAPHIATLATPGKRDRDIAMQALHVMGIAALADQALTEISTGERQL